MKGVQSIDEEVFRGFDRITEYSPDATALYYLGEKFSYRRVQELINRFAAALSDLGVKKNDKVMIYLGNCPQWIIAYFAIQKAGGVPVPTSPIYTPYEIGYQLNDCQAETIICHDTNIGYVSEVFSRTPLKRVIVTNLVDMLPDWKKFIGWAFDRIPRGHVEKGEGVYFFKELIKKYPAEPPRIEINPREHLAYILYTGGTTGTPKGVPGTHSGMVSYIKDYYSVIEGHVSEGNDCFLLINPLFHIMAKGMFMGVALTLGNPTVLMPAPVTDAVLESIQRYKVTTFLGVPALYRMILENDRLDMYDLSSLKFCWSGGDVLPVETFKRFKNLTGCSIYQVYGSTEVGHLSLSPMEAEPSPKSLGIPFSSREVKVVDPDTMEEVPTGEAGELFVTSEFLMEYWNKPEETAHSFVTMEGKRWYKMGDFVRLDHNGELHYVDRRADIIKHKAFRVSASEIEAVLQDHEAVLEACAVGVSDAKVGERIKAMVVLKKDARGVGANELISFCKERMAAYKVPQYIEFRDMLPKSKVGKLLRREIREEERRRQAQ